MRRTVRHQIESLGTYRPGGGKGGISVTAAVAALLACGSVWIISLREIFHGLLQHSNRPE